MKTRCPHTCVYNTPPVNGCRRCAKAERLRADLAARNVETLRADLAAARGWAEKLARALQGASEDLNWMCNNREYLSWHVLVERAVKVCFALEAYKESKQ